MYRNRLVCVLDSHTELSWTVRSLQLRVKETGIGLYDRDSAIEGVQGVEGILGLNHGSQIESQILWVKVRLESVRQGLLLARCNLDSILSSSQIAYDARSRTRRAAFERPQAAAHKLHGDWIGLFIQEGQA